jgi:3-phosphoshikimate 1-carboxyvinyltransferase
MIKTVKPGKRKGIISIPASKSDTQRALLAAALATGESHVFNVGTSDDEARMLTTIQALGARVEEVSKSHFKIIGIAQFPQEATIYVGESGLGMRLISTVCAAHVGSFNIVGEGSLITRSMSFFDLNLPKFGGEIVSANGYLPLTIKGPMKGDEVEVDGSESSQYISGLMMALPLVEGDSVVDVRDLNSLPYVQMTLNTLHQFGIEIEHQNYSTFKIKGSQNYEATDYSIESDWSSASYWLVASALGMDFKLSGLSLTSLQADKQILIAFEAANCVVDQKEDFLTVDGTNRKAFEFDATQCPDLFPALVTLASSCKGISVIQGVDRLANKESNRGLTLQSEFGKLGVQIDLLGDEMLIHGTGKITGGLVESHHDHRIAMCLAIAGFVSEGPIIIQDAEAVTKSYPAFWEQLDSLLIH